MTDEEVLTVTQAAAYLGLTRQAIAGAAQRGEIGRRHPAIGVRGGFVYVFTRAELDEWAARPRQPGGRPKSDAMTPTPAVIA